MRILLFIFSFLLLLLTVDANELFIRNAKEAGEIGDFLSKNHFENIKDRKGKIEVCCGLYGKDTAETHIEICGINKEEQDDIILLLQTEIQKRDWKPICVVFQSFVSTSPDTPNSNGKKEIRTEIIESKAKPIRQLAEGKTQKQVPAKNNVISSKEQNENLPSFGKVAVLVFIFTFTLIIFIVAIIFYIKKLQ